MTTLRGRDLLPLLAGVAMVGGARSTWAQGRPAGCAAIDSTAVWYRAQRAWLDDSRGGWSDSAFRSALARSVGVDLSHPQPMQLGAGLAGAVPPAAPSDEGEVLGRLRTLAQQRGSPLPVRSAVGGASSHSPPKTSHTSISVARRRCCRRWP